MSSPLVSVVIPTYNQPALLAETLGTVLAQTFADFEVVIIDDGSTDERTPAYLASLTDPRVRVIRQDNRGIGAARNRGIDEARGRYVALLDHDDLWAPEKLAVQVAYAERHPECSVVLVPWASSTAPDRCAFDLDKVRDGDGLVERPLRRLAEGHAFMTSSAMLFPRERAAGLRYQTRRQCIEDQPFHFGLFARGRVGIAGERILMVYRWHESNSSREAAYWYNGQRLLRRMHWAGAFADLVGQDADLRAFLGQFGRATAVRQLLAGCRARGIHTYLREWPHQVRERRWRFLAAFPLLAVAPQPVLRRMWAGEVR